jgi:hypothetical protein
MKVITGSHQVTEPTITESTGGCGYRWTLPMMTRADLEKLRTPELDHDVTKTLKKAKATKSITKPIALKDLQAWNKLVRQHEAGEILEHGLRQAQAILLVAERLL